MGHHQIKLTWFQIMKSKRLVIFLSSMFETEVLNLVMWHSKFACYSLNLNSELQLAGFYNNMVATDTSKEQLSFAPKLPNIC